MEIGVLRTQWIACLSSWYTVNYCSRLLFRSLFGKIDRTWSDEIIHRWSTRVLELAGISYKIINPQGIEPQPGQATMIMCNHSSAYDIPISFKIFPHHSIRMLAKKELSRIPFMGKAMKRTEFAFIDRKNRHQAIKDLAYARELMETGIVMWIAPEGTRSKDGKLAPLKKGAIISAIQAQAQIIPVGIRGAYTILPPHARRLKLNQEIELHVGQPLDASLFTIENKDELVAKVYHAINALIA